jgi:hypothetical protein
MFVSCLVLSSSFSVMADEDNDHIYLGFGFSTGSGTIEAESRGMMTDTDVDQDQTRLIIGYQFRSQKRVQLSFTSIDLETKSSGGETEYSGVDIDWHFPFLKDATVQPYLGVGFGLYEYEDTGELFYNNGDLEGVAFNVMAGLLIPVNEHIEFEVAYQVKVISWQTIEYQNNYSYDYGYYSGTEEIELTSVLSSVALSARYKF